MGEEEAGAGLGKINTAEVDYPQTDQVKGGRFDKIMSRSEQKLPQYLSIEYLRHVHICFQHLANLHTEK